MKFTQLFGAILGSLIILILVFASHILSSSGEITKGTGIVGLAFGFVILPLLFLYALSGALSTVILLKNRRHYADYLKANFWRFVFYLNGLLLTVIALLFFVFPALFKLFSH